MEDWLAALVGQAFLPLRLLRRLCEDFARSERKRGKKADASHKGRKVRKGKEPKLKYFFP